MPAICSLGLPKTAWASQHPDEAIAFLEVAIDKTADIGALALTGVTYGGIGERTGQPPTEAELDNVARAMTAAAKRAKARGIEIGIEAVNRYENHIINTAAQAVALVERIGADNVFVHLYTYHMNIEERGMGNGILTARDHLKYIHLSESDRGTPGEGNCNWNETFVALAAIGFSGGLAMESFINMPPQVALGLSVWRPVADSEAVVMGRGLPFLRNKARQYGLIP
jgi:D-psicose/D-tagatose/L-ribulose 3-epimerase